jgi:hypothetical protein
MPFRSVSAARFALFVASFAAASPAPLAAQRDSSRTALGLSSVGAFAFLAGGARIERHVNGAEIGGQLDLGYFASPRLRVTADVSFLRSFPLEEHIEIEGMTYRDSFYDLSGSTGVTLLGAAPPASITPYIGAGVGVHALSSNFGSIVIDTRYNSNNFGLLGTLGLRARVGRSGRRAVQLELRRVQAKNVSRVSLHLGIVTLFNDLARR